MVGPGAALTRGAGGGCGPPLAGKWARCQCLGPNQAGRVSLEAAFRIPQMCQSITGPLARPVRQRSGQAACHGFPGQPGPPGPAAPPVRHVQPCERGRRPRARAAQRRPAQGRTEGGMAQPVRLRAREHAGPQTMHQLGRSRCAGSGATSAPVPAPEPDWLHRGPRSGPGSLRFDDAAIIARAPPQPPDRFQCNRQPRSAGITVPAQP